MTISFNRGMFYSKIIILVVIVVVAVLFEYFRPRINFQDAPIGGIMFLVFISCFLIFLLAIMILQLLFLPIGVEIDEITKSLVLKFICRKNRVVQTNDISEFSLITVVTKSARYDGVLLKTVCGKDFVLGDFNLEDYKPIRDFLEKFNIPFAGKEKFGFVSYFIKYFEQPKP